MKQLLVLILLSAWTLMSVAEEHNLAISIERQINEELKGISADSSSWGDFATIYKAKQEISKGIVTAKFLEESHGVVAGVDMDRLLERAKELKSISQDSRL